MSIQPDFRAEDWEALKTTAALASSLYQTVADLGVPIPRYPLPDDIDTKLPELTLSVPSDTLAPIYTLSVPGDLRDAILNRLTQFINELAQQFKSSYKHTCLEIIRKTNSLDEITTIHRTYESLAHRMFLPKIHSHVSFILTEVAKRQTPSVDDRRSFNQEFTPVLEKYFESNGYPSLAHRSILAQKSMMIPRQIEVWFQNHRNRAKKEGKTVHRLASDFPLHQALSVLKDVSYHRNRLPTPPSDDLSVESKGQSNKMAMTKSNQASEPCYKCPTILDESSSRPPHAFPATKNSSYPDPFPNDGGIFRFPKPEWKRRPTTISVTPVAIDMDEFAQAFHLKLNFSEVPRRHAISSPKQGPHPSQPWFAATTTFTSPAPHPALVRLSEASHLSASSLPSLLNDSILPTFGSASLSASTISHPGPLMERSSRKIRALPRRGPLRTQSDSFGSRTSSFGSDASSGSRSSSSSSSSPYLSSPELSTPPPLPPLDLPVFHDGHEQQDPFGFSHAELDVDYSLSNFLPSQDLTVASLYPGANKFTDTPLFDHIFTDFSHDLGEIIP